MKMPSITNGIRLLDAFVNSLSHCVVSLEIVGANFPFHLCLYLHNSLENYLDYHILDILGHVSKCLDIMGLDLLGLDILGIIRYSTMHRSHTYYC